MVDRLAPNVNRLRVELAAAGVVHFDVDELLGIHKPEKARSVGFVGRHFEPDDRQVECLVEVAQLAERIREKVGMPLIVHSGLRPMPYDRLVATSRHRTHTLGRALDLTCKDVSKLRAVARRMWECEEWHGGLGLYVGNIHIDTWLRRKWGSQW